MRFYISLFLCMSIFLASTNAQSGKQQSIDFDSIANLIQNDSDAIREQTKNRNGSGYLEMLDARGCGFARASLSDNWKSGIFEYQHCLPKNATFINSKAYIDNLDFSEANKIEVGNEDRVVVIPCKAMQDCNSGNSSSYFNDGSKSIGIFLHSESVANELLKLLKTR